MTTFVRCDVNSSFPSSLSIFFFIAFLWRRGSCTEEKRTENIFQFGKPEEIMVLNVHPLPLSTQNVPRFVLLQTGAWLFDALLLSPMKNTKKKRKLSSRSPEKRVNPQLFHSFPHQATVLLRHPSTHIKGKKQGNSHELFPFQCERWDIFFPSGLIFSNASRCSSLFRLLKLSTPSHLRKYDPFILLFFDLIFGEAWGLKPGKITMIKHGRQILFRNKKKVFSAFVFKIFSICCSIFHLLIYFFSFFFIEVVVGKLLFFSLSCRLFRSIFLHTFFLPCPLISMLRSEKSCDEFLQHFPLSFLYFVSSIRKFTSNLERVTSSIIVYFALHAGCLQRLALNKKKQERSKKK